ELRSLPRESLLGHAPLRDVPQHSCEDLLAAQVQLGNRRLSGKDLAGLPAASNLSTLSHYPRRDRRLPELPHAVHVRRPRTFGDQDAELTSQHLVTGVAKYPFGALVEEDDPLTL